VVCVLTCGASYFTEHFLADPLWTGNHWVTQQYKEQYKTLDKDAREKFIQEMKDDLAGLDTERGESISALLHKTSLQFQELVSNPLLPSGTY
jgi:hypothetical protein